jgi:hypothetical protein
MADNYEGVRSWCQVYDKTELRTAPYTPAEGGGFAVAKTRLFAKKNKL